jgi:hypothetical protein
MSHVYKIINDYKKMMQSFGLSEDQSEEVLIHFGGMDKVDRILYKFGHSTLSYLPTIAKEYQKVPVTFPDHVTIPDGKSYFLLLFLLLLY